MLLAAAVGKPDPLRTEIVKAFLVLKPGHEGTDALKAEIQAFVRTRLSAHEYPREIEFIDEMPLTTTGKVIRRILRDRGVTLEATGSRAPHRLLANATIPTFQPTLIASPIASAHHLPIGTAARCSAARPMPKPRSPIRLLAITAAVALPPRRAAGSRSGST